MILKIINFKLAHITNVSPIHTGLVLPGDLMGFRNHHHVFAVCHALAKDKMSHCFT